MKELAICTASLLLGGYLASQVDAMEDSMRARQMLGTMLVCIFSAIGCAPLLIRLIDKCIMRHSKPLNNRED